MIETDLVIVGSGPAGYTAALYAARADLRPVVIEGFAWGGLLQETTDVENYPGFVDGIMGPALMGQMRAQAERFGAQLITDQANSVTVATSEGERHIVTVGEQTYAAKTLILATGSTHRKLDVPGELELSGRGVSYCATCDAAFFRDKQVVVVGGGDSAMEEAMFLAKFASHVTIVHRREEFAASAIMLDRARQTPNITILPSYTVSSLEAGEDGSLGSVQLQEATTGAKKEIAADGIFIAIGHLPQTAIIAGQIALDEAGYIITGTHEVFTTQTSVPGVFAAGDVVDHQYRQAITAAGVGCAAALDVERYLATF